MSTCTALSRRCLPAVCFLRRAMVTLIASNTLQGVANVLLAATHFEVLEVRADATDQEVRAAYRRLALRFHPDKCSENGAQGAFVKVGRCKLDPGRLESTTRFSKF